MDPGSDDNPCLGDGQETSVSKLERPVEGGTGDRAKMVAVLQAVVEISLGNQGRHSLLAGGCVHNNNLCPGCWGLVPDVWVPG